jgi:hypothetical protein
MLCIVVWSRGASCWCGVFLHGVSSAFRTTIPCLSHAYFSAIPRSHGTARTCACTRRLLLFKSFVELSGGVHRTVHAFPDTMARARSSAGSMDPMLRQLTVPKQFYHSKTGMPILPNEVDCDSDDDVDESWITNQSDRVRNCLCPVRLGWLQCGQCWLPCRQCWLAGWWYA